MIAMARSLDRPGIAGKDRGRAHMSGNLRRDEMTVRK